MHIINCCERCNLIFAKKWILIHSYSLPITEIDVSKTDGTQNLKKLPVVTHVATLKGDRRCDSDSAVIFGTWVLITESRSVLAETKSG